MNTVANLLKLDKTDLDAKKKTFEIEIPRISNLLHKKGIDEKFYITCETVDFDTLYDYENDIYELEDNKIKLNKNAMYKKGLEICSISIIDPKYDDKDLINFLGINMKQPNAELVWKKLFVKGEIANISQKIIDYSRTVLGNEEDNIKKLDNERKKIKN